jgi:hypothetical protein
MSTVKEAWLQIRAVYDETVGEGGRELLAKASTVEELSDNLTAINGLYEDQWNAMAKYLESEEVKITLAGNGTVVPAGVANIWQRPATNCLDVALDAISEDTEDVDDEEDYGTETLVTMPDVTPPTTPPTTPPSSPPATPGRRRLAVLEQNIQRDMESVRALLAEGAGR